MWLSIGAIPTRVQTPFPWSLLSQRFSGRKRIIVRTQHSHWLHLGGWECWYARDTFQSGQTWTGRGPAQTFTLDLVHWLIPLFITAASTPECLQVFNNWYGTRWPFPNCQFEKDWLLSCSKCLVLLRKSASFALRLPPCLSGEGCVYSTPLSLQRVKSKGAFKGQWYTKHFLMAEFKPISCHTVHCSLYFDFPRHCTCTLHYQKSNGSKNVSKAHDSEAFISEDVFLHMFFSW